jgi:1-deoxy-D-xylulose-5-phosphate synthase
VSKICDKLEAEGILVGHFDARFVKPLDAAMLHHVFSHYPKVITIEDATIMGGFGSAVIEFMVDNHYTSEVKRLGIPDRFVEHGTPDELHAECSMDTECLYCTVKKMLGIQFHCQ